MAERHKDTVWLWNTQKSPTLTCPLPLHVPGETALAGLGIRFIADVVPADGAFEKCEARQACLDIESIQSSLTVRFPQPGDRFYPLGAPGHKKLKDFFIDKKIPRAERPCIPLLMSGGEIAWVVGYRIADPFKVRPETRRMLRLRCESMGGYGP
jgi:tRNA(Ile)-lysidine synthase